MLPVLTRKIRSEWPREDRLTIQNTHRVCQSLLAGADEVIE
jgi:hypothetical protein